MIFDSHVPLKQSAELQWTEVDIPETIIKFFQSNVLSDGGCGDIDPLTLPSNAAIGTDVSDLESVRVFERW